MTTTLSICIAARIYLVLSCIPGPLCILKPYSISKSIILIEPPQTLATFITDCVRILLKHGADPYIAAADGYPVEFAKDDETLLMLEAAMRKNGPKPQSGKAGKLLH